MRWTNTAFQPSRIEQRAIEDNRNFELVHTTSQTLDFIPVWSNVGRDVKSFDPIQSWQFGDTHQLRVTINDHTQVANGSDGKQQMGMLAVERGVDLKRFHESKAMLPAADWLLSANDVAQPTILQVQVNGAIPLAAVSDRELIDLLFDQRDGGRAQSRIADDVVPQANHFTPAVFEVFEVVGAHQSHVRIIRIFGDGGDE